MASTLTLIISFGERKRLLSKPAKYTSLLECARRFFLELQGLQDEEIVFYFKPEWFDEELELDDSAFQQVHDKAQLRIETRKMPTFNGLKRLVDLSRETASTKTEPDQKRVKIEQHQQEHIDLTGSPSLTPSNLPPAVTMNTSPGLPAAETPTLQQSRQDIGTAVREGPSDPGVDWAFPPSAHPDRSTDDASVQSRAAVLPPSATTTQDQALTITALTSDNFPVDITSPIRHTCPTRQIVAEEWVGCNKPWAAADEAARDTHQFSVRLLTEHHAIRLTFKSKHVHIATLLKHAVERGYPGPMEQLEFRTAEGFSPSFYDHSFHLNHVENHSDVYVFRDNRPGVYLLPPKPDSWRIPYTPLPHVRIGLQLSSELRDSSLYPWAAVETIGQREEAKWDVSTSPEGNITSQVGHETYYGGPSWELSPSLEFANNPPPNNQQPGFAPLPPSGLLGKLLTPDTAIVLSARYAFHQLEGHAAETDYLMRVLTTQLKLSPKMAQSFKDYFLGYNAHLQLATDDKGRPRSIAITFVPHEQLEKIAPLQITPVPATTSRIFMLWGEVQTRLSVGPWASWYAAERSPTAAFQAKNWAQIVGLDLEGQENKREFTAIEWGMMKVPKAYLVKDPRVLRAERVERAERAERKQRRKEKDMARGIMPRSLIARSGSN